MVKRRWLPRETRMLADWISKHYPDVPHEYRVWLGRLPPEAVRAEELGITPQIYAPFGKWADAAIYLPDKTILVECKVKMDLKARGELETYRELFYVTERFKDRWGLPLELVLLYAYEDRDVKAWAEREGIRLEFYRPPYIEEYVKERMKVGAF